MFVLHRMTGSETQNKYGHLIEKQKVIFLYQQYDTVDNDDTVVD